MKRFKILLFMFLTFSLAGMAQAPFTAGNIVVFRVGDNVTDISADVTAAYPVFLDEYTPSGTLVQSIAMPTAVSGANHILTSSGVGTGEGWLTLSSNGQFLVLMGYDVAPGTANVSNTTSTSTPRVIGLVKYDGTINTTTALTDFSSGFGVQGAISTNGTDLWAGSSSSGLSYTTIGSTSSTIISTNPLAYTNLNITGGQLYASSNVGTVNVGTVGTGIPVTSGQVLTNLPGFPTGFNQTFQFTFADLNAGVPGIDVLYVANATSKALSKYSLVGGAWILNGTIGSNADDYAGLTATVSGTTVTLFATREGDNDIGGGELVKIVDASGYNGAFSGTPTVIAATPYDAASFRGVALVPQAPSVKVAIKTFLQGAYSTGLSRHKDVTATWAGVLNSNALSQPYNTTAFGNYAGTESVSSGFFTSTGATTDILDWVLVELRNSATPATVVARRAAFIREDGRIVDLDGTSDVSFPGVTAGNYYVVVRHRNHLPIRSSSAIALSSTATLYDFSAQQSNAYQDGAITTNAAMKDVSGSNTVFAMWGGNANSNTKVSFTGVNNDAGSILGALGGNQGLVLSSVYNFADLNLDGSVKYTGTNNDSGLLLSVLGSNQAAVYTQHQ